MTRYRIEDRGDVRRYAPSLGYYLGLAVAVLPLVVSLVHHLQGREVEPQPLVLGAVLTLGILGAWRTIVVDTGEVRVLGPVWRKRFPLHELGPVRRSGATDGVRDAVTLQFRELGGRHAFRLFPYLRRRNECARLILGRIRRAREGTFE